MTRLKELREEYGGISINELSQRIHISVALLKIFEKAEFIPEDEANKIADFFNVLPSYLLNIQDKKFPKKIEFIDYCDNEEYFVLAIKIIDRLLVSEFIKNIE